MSFTENKTRLKLFVSSLIIFITACDKSETIGPDLVPFIPVESVIQDKFENIEYVVYGNSTHRTMVAYSRRIAEDSVLLDFKKSPQAFPFIFADNEGNVWDVFGLAVSGPRKGQTLTPVNSMMGYWFSFASIFPEVTIYGGSEKEKITSNISDPEWLVDNEYVFRGTFKDAIPALSFPSYNLLGGQDLVNESLYVTNDELVMVIPGQESTKVIPYQVLDWHEVVNDKADGTNIVISYCPLTGTSTAWERPTETIDSEFGVSGLLHNNNLILYDQGTDSYWSQIKEQAIHGSLIGTRAVGVRSVEMTWRASKLLQKGLLSLLDNSTGFDRDYSIYPYGDYKTNNENLSFSVSFVDTRVPNKEKVFAVIANEKAKVYRFEHFK